MSSLRTPTLAILLAILIPAVAHSSEVVLHQQVPEGYAKPFTMIANQKVERIFLTAYQTQYQKLRLEGKHDEANALLNAPISGTTSRRGRNLLTFAAFSGFLKLASWGINTGADINRGDKDNATMLRMAVANKLEYIVEYTLRRGADPNMLQGASKDNTFGDMIRFGWPISGFELAWKHGARLRSPEQRHRLEAYLTAITSEDAASQDRLHYFLSLLNSPLALLSQIEPETTSKPARLVDTYMIGVMDQALLDSMKNQLLVNDHISQFNAHGMYLPHYLTFNGMTRSLYYILDSLPPADAAELVIKRDRTGNDLVLAAIKSLDPELLGKVLSLSAEHINESVPDQESYYSRGDTPLHIAIKWNSSEAVFNQLFKYGAEKSLETENGDGLTPVQLLDMWYKDSKDYPRLKNSLMRTSVSDVGGNQE